MDDAPNRLAAAAAAAMRPPAAKKTDGPRKPKPQGPSLDDARAAAVAEWERRTQAWVAQAQAAGPNAQPSAGGLDPKDVRVEVGPPMTEDEFLAWQERRKKASKNFSRV